MADSPDQLQDATIRVVQHGSYKRTGVLILVDKLTLVSKELLVKINLCLRTLWAATSVVIKPWADRVGVNRTENGIANELTVAAGKLAKLFRSSNRLICIHGSGKAVINSPSAPPTPNIELMLSTEVDTYLRAVSESNTTDEAWIHKAEPAQEAPTRAQAWQRAKSRLQLAGPWQQTWSRR